MIFLCDEGVWVAFSGLPRVIRFELTIKSNDGTFKGEIIDLGTHFIRLYLG